MRELALVSRNMMTGHLTFWYRFHNLFPCPPDPYLAGGKPVQTLFLDQSQALKTKSQDRRRNSDGFWWLLAEFVQRDAFLVRTTNLEVCEVSWNNGVTGSLPVLSPVILFTTKNTFSNPNRSTKHSKRGLKRWPDSIKAMNWFHQCQTQRESITNSAYQTADRELSADPGLTYRIGEHSTGARHRASEATAISWSLGSMATGSSDHI